MGFVASNPEICQVSNVLSYDEYIVLSFSGNCVVLKPSELSEHTARLLEKILPEYVDKVIVSLIFSYFFVYLYNLVIITRLFL